MNFTFFADFEVMTKIGPFSRYEIYITSKFFVHSLHYENFHKSPLNFINNQFPNISLFALWIFNSRQPFNIFQHFFAAWNRDTNFNDAFYDGVCLVSTFFGDDSSDFRRFSSLIEQYLLCRHQFELIMLTRHMKISVHCFPLYFEKNLCAFATKFSETEEFRNGRRGWTESLGTKICNLHLSFRSRCINIAAHVAIRRKSLEFSNFLFHWVESRKVFQSRDMGV